MCPSHFFGIVVVDDVHPGLHDVREGRTGLGKGTLRSPHRRQRLLIWIAFMGDRTVHDRRATRDEDQRAR
jgi:hypothetical protein